MQAGSLRPDLLPEERGGGGEPGHSHPLRHPRDQGGHRGQSGRPGRHQLQGTTDTPLLEAHPLPTYLPISSAVKGTVVQDYSVSGRNENLHWFILSYCLPH